MKFKSRIWEDQMDQVIPNPPVREESVPAGKCLIVVICGVPHPFREFEAVTAEQLEGGVLYEMNEVNFEHFEPSHDGE